MAIPQSRPRGIPAGTPVTMADVIGAVGDIGALREAALSRHRIDRTSTDGLTARVLPLSSSILAGAGCSRHCRL